ncbi:MAG: hypothetical protein HKN39_02950 [Flavobacteriales bacterium]|nr:hypothetical protein [Flavobacteriales bacterium]
MHLGQRTTFFFALLILVFSCKNNVSEPADPGYEYFPLVIGHWVSYQVDSVVHDDDLGIHDHFSYQVKELVESSFEDNEGDIAFRIERFKRKSDTLEWVLSDIWTAKRTNTLAEKVEENVRYVRLAFPTRLNKTWDNNANNTHEEWESEILGVQNLYDNGIEVFNDVCEVSMIDQINAVDAKLGQQVYAKGIGLVYHRLDTLDFIFPGPGGTVWPDSVIRFGRQFEMTYLEHGVE